MVDDELNSEDGGVQRFSVSLSLDRDNFFRRECDNCGLEFKTRAHEADIAWFLSNIVERNSDFTATPAGETEEGVSFLICPYCERKDKSSSFMTTESIDYLRRFAQREIVMPMIERQFANMASGFGRGSGSGFLKVTMTHSRDIRAVRAIHGPDVSDMVIIELLCCGEELKIREGWFDLKHCPFCEAAVKI